MRRPVTVLIDRCGCRCEHERGGVWTAADRSKGARLPARGRLRRRHRARHGRPLPLPADPRRARPAPDQRGPARAVLGRARRARAPLRHPDRAVTGTSFAVWAPNARGVRVSGDFNYWDGAGLPDALARLPAASGSCSSPTSAPAPTYKFDVLGADGHLAGEGRPDGLRTPSTRRPGVRRLRVDATSGATPSGSPSARRQTPSQRADEHLRGAPRLVAAGAGLRAARRPAGRLRRATCGFTHVEFLPVAEHPFGGSWGYQVTSYFAPTSRFGSPDDFRYLVDKLHQAGIGVIVDWVPAHFPKDEWALARFDGTPLYEHPDPSRGEHPDWGTLIFDFGRREVRNFLVANAAVLARGVPRRRPAGRRRRLDALPRLLAQGRRVAAEHLRRPREPRGGVVPAGDERDRLPASSRRRHHRRGVDGLAGRHPPTHLGGLGFGFKWNMGWMHDSLDYMSARADLPPLPPPPDDVLDDVRLLRELRAADLARRGRARQGLAAAQDAGRPVAAVREPAGATSASCGRTPASSCCSWAREFGQDAEWSEERSLDWWLLDSTTSTARCSGWSATSTAPTSSHPALWSRRRPDRLPLDRRQRRLEQHVLVLPPQPDGSCWSACRTSPGDRTRATGSACPPGGRWHEVLNTDATEYFGSGVGNEGAVWATDEPWHGLPASTVMRVPPMATVWLRKRAD